MKYLLALMSGLKITDGVLTDHFVRQGVVQEGNKLVAKIVVDGRFLLITIAGAFLCGLVLWLLARRFPRLAGITAASVSVFYGAVLTWNLSLILGA